MTDHMTLVTGGTGKTGRRVVQRLTARDWPVRVGSRSGGVPFDWADQDTWEPALEGVTAAYLSYFPDLAAPGAPEAIGSFAEAALRSGTRRLVLLSGRGEEEAQASEKVLADSGADWTVLRCSWFAQNFSEGYLVDALAAGDLSLPAGDVGEPFVDVDDIADAAAAVLTEDGHLGQIYELTGPRLLTFAEAVAAIAGATGRTLGYHRIPADDFAAGLASDGVPDDLVGLLTYLFTTVLDGRNAYVCDGVQRVLGRPARDFSDYVRDAAATGVWNAR
ncbi:NAD(P)H-binding protein [Actinomadura madurae]|uniref:NAD(P)H-binding protein n=1 Tax=Actinomadura madurae TaxID=1993 RepID=UPI0020266514|nr:NAD(P)H-binding protein [Actinomadura madurae]MCP9952655.1 NAD(P)H-binding protein [Actinomadura madurae]MCP9969419.1 NAD(P)H-binding protein [Actinomadura madurae]MCP9981880.1 NAD(P)H-binding protein [Actinomadura madurae]MCQ0018109.1 NAD(P)H-binding protein [Actinomadura madurae]URM98168.1 NAD(P)H-binding protein [Actinomadura madurae]